MTKRIIGFLLILGAWGASAFAAPSVVYVTFNGSDAAVCSRTAPCHTITHALSVVAAGGVVDIAASGLYDSFTVAKSVTVTTDPGVVATIAVPASKTGVTVNAAATDVVTLRGLTLIGVGSGTGISIQSVSRATVEACDSRNFFHALEYVTSVAGTLEVKGGSFTASDTSIFLCCNVTPSPGIAVSVDGAHVYGGHFAGVNGDGAHISVTKTLLSGDPGCGTNNAGIYAVHGTTVAENDTITGYCDGFRVFDTGYISASTITGNTFGLAEVGGTLFTRGNNVVANNGTNVSGTLTSFPAQ